MSPGLISCFSRKHVQLPHDLACAALSEWIYEPIVEHLPVPGLSAWYIYILYCISHIIVICYIYHNYITYIIFDHIVWIQNGCKVWNW